MSLRNFHVDANITDSQLLARSDGIAKNFISAFRQAAANGSFKLGGVELKDPDLNRVHSIITEIDSRRMFYACGEEEIPKHAMTSFYEARKAIRDTSKGVWADQSCERLVQEIIATLNVFCTLAERLHPEELGGWSPDTQKFMQVMTDMRLAVWVLVAFLKKKLGSVIKPRNLPLVLWDQISKIDI
jgi:hypothetical protein